MPPLMRVEQCRFTYVKARRGITKQRLDVNLTGIRRVVS